MPRRGYIPKREVLPDPLYHSKLVSKLINVIMQDGKKSTSERIVYGAFEIIREKTGQDPLKIFKQAIENIKPILEVRPRRVGGATYQVPMEVRPNRRLSLALRWLKTYSRQRKEKTMRERLAAEILDAYNNVGACIKKREETHKMAEANRAFAHYRW
ncbi:30S ribosomal protein S7 [Thermodesulfovibrio hydrogeniphilus]